MVVKSLEGPGNELIPTEDQAEALKRVNEWFHSGQKKVFKLGGLAGTGKSSLVPWIHESLGLTPWQIQYVAPTNKAALVVQNRLTQNNIKANAKTLHRVYYRKEERHCDECPMTETTRNVCHGRPGFNRCGCYLDFNATLQSDPGIQLVVCDESSMVSRSVHEDLLNSCRDTVKILFIGDHGQLEAVEDDIALVKRYGKFDLMKNPDYILTEIQRQAKGSPILQLAYQARQGYPIEFGEYGPGVSKVPLSDELDINVKQENMVAITYFANVDVNNNYHKGRISVSQLNEMWRRNLGIKSPHPITGERLVSREFIRRVSLPKGTLGRIIDINIDSPESYLVKMILDDGQEYEGQISAKQLGQNKAIWGLHHLEKWDYGYALTCHTAQGSEFDSVVLFEPSKSFAKWLGPVSYSRWLYTAITRAKHNLLIVG